MNPLASWGSLALLVIVNVGCFAFFLGGMRADVRNLTRTIQEGFDRATTSHEQLADDVRAVERDVTQVKADHAHLEGRVDTLEKMRPAA